MNLSVNLLVRIL